MFQGKEITCHNMTSKIPEVFLSKYIMVTFLHFLNGTFKCMPGSGTETS